MAPLATDFKTDDCAAALVVSLLLIPSPASVDVDVMSAALASCMVFCAASVRAAFGALSLM